MRKNVIPWWKTNIGRSELKKIKESINNRHISQGPVTEKLEKRLGRLLDVPYVVLTTSGSTALLMALIAYGIRPGDEVILPGLSFIATAQAPLLLGAKVKLVDVEHSRPLIDAKKIENAITPKTKAIIPAHLNGRAADIEYIDKLAAKHGLGVIEDAAEALCSRNCIHYLGTQSDVGVFSLAMTKLITTGQGGFLATRSKDIFERLQKVRNHGMLSRTADLMSYNTFGFNFKFNDILAGMGLSQTEKVKEKIKAHKNIYNFYIEELNDLDYIKIIKVDVARGEVPLWVETLCSERNKVISLLKDKNIQAKAFDPGLSDAFYLKSKGDFKYSNFYAKHGLILPCGPDQSLDDLKFTVKVLKKIKKEIKINLNVAIS